MGLGLIESVCILNVVHLRDRTSHRPMMRIIDTRMKLYARARPVTGQSLVNREEVPAKRCSTLPSSYS